MRNLLKSFFVIICLSFFSGCGLEVQELPGLDSDATKAGNPNNNPQGEDEESQPVDDGPEVIVVEAPEVEGDTIEDVAGGMGSEEEIAPEGETEETPDYVVENYADEEADEEALGCSPRRPVIENGVITFVQDETDPRPPCEITEEQTLEPLEPEVTVIKTVTVETTTPVILFIKR